MAAAVAVAVAAARDVDATANAPRPIAIRGQSHGTPLRQALKNKKTEGGVVGDDLARSKITSNLSPFPHFSE